MLTLHFNGYILIDLVGLEHGSDTDGKAMPIERISGIVRNRSQHRHVHIARVH